MSGIQAPPASPLSVAQEGVWVLSLLAPRRVSYNEAIAIHKEGPLDVGALRLAFREILRRHAAWRTTFELIDGEPVQVVHPVLDLAMPVLDLTDLTWEEAERQTARVTGRTAAVPYDLRRGPLVRPWLVHFPGQHHRLVLAMHHIVFDGVSLARVILPDLVALYEAFACGERPERVEPTASYLDYAHWEREWSCGERFERRLSYWRTHLADVQPLSLPVDRTPPKPRSFRGASVPLRLEADELASLGGVAAEAGGTLFQALATVWSVLLARVCGQDEVVFATAADLRQRREFEGVVGYALTPLVLRVQLDQTASFSHLLVRVRNELLDGLDHLVPFERVVRDIGEARSEDANPIYGTMIILEPAYETSDSSWSLHQVAGEVNSVVGGTKLDLELQLDERPDGHLQGRLIYDRELFSAASARHLADLWVRLARAAVAEPGRAIGSLPLTTAAEARLQLIEWNATSVEQLPTTIDGMLSEAGGSDDPPRLTIAEQAVELDELERLADAALARHRDGETSPASIVDVVAVPAIETVAQAWGALRAGYAYRLVDPVGGALATRTAVTPEGVCCVARRLWPDGEAVEVPIRHAAVGNLARVFASEIRATPHDTVLLLSEELSERSLLVLWAALAAGADVVLTAGGEEEDGAAVSRLLRRHEANVLVAAPERWEALVASGLRARRGLVAVSFGGPLTSELAQQILARAPVLWSAYGSAETTLCATLAYVQRSQPLTIGRPIANLRGYVVDLEGQPVPVGVVGELLFAGTGVTSGYLGSRGPTDAAFTEAPDGSGHAFRTGERARWLADGQLGLV